MSWPPPPIYLYSRISPFPWEKGNSLVKIGNFTSPVYLHNVQMGNFPEILMSSLWLIGQSDQEAVLWSWGLHAIFSVWLIYLQCIIFGVSEIREPSCFAVWLTTLPQKKRDFNLPIFPGSPGILTLTQGHMDFRRWLVLKHLMNVR